ncbi:hypothetical protein WOLCODRAFT_150734 [Wolfiporia cocos MD-104 SS10]|uniref:Uncharacterized protein n=1 Tax=Wolfiporia cocos (strain MD-104) TaxID=742152 RepID=A0A2H3JEM9_WOLCO|nr:hypothetical protein WOLCODRAFT_150734 [Wolfiporia cocos MD-104 SS10]
MASVMTLSKRNRVNVALLKITLALKDLQQASRVLQDVPRLPDLVGIAYDIVIAVQDVQSNKKVTISIAQRVGEFAKQIYKEATTKREVTFDMAALDACLVVIQEDLVEMLDKLKKQISNGSLKRWKNRTNTKGILEGCIKQISEAQHAFELDMVSLCTQIDTDRQDEPSLEPPSESLLLPPSEQPTEEEAPEYEPKQPEDVMPPLSELVYAGFGTAPKDGGHVMFMKIPSLKRRTGILVVVLPSVLALIAATGRYFAR